MDDQNMITMTDHIHRLLKASDAADTHIEIRKKDLETFLNRFDLLHTICENIPDGIFAKDLQGRVIMSNSAGPRNIGKSITDVVGKNAYEIFSSETAEQMEKNDQLVFESEQPQTFETTEKALAFMTTKTPYRDRQGEVIGLLGISRNMTDQKNAEEALRESETQFRKLLDTAPDAIVGVDQDGRIVMINDQAEQIFGYQREELLKQPVEMLMPKRFRNPHVANRIRFTDTPRTRPMGLVLDLFGQHKDGREFPVEISLSPLETKDGKLITSIIRDVTQRKEMEEKLRRHTIELEEQVLQSERLATVGRMAAQVAHEIRNPLSSIGLNIELLADEIQNYQWKKSEEATGLIQIILSEIERLNNVIHDYLQFARMPSHDLEDVSINSLIDELVKFVQPEASKAHVHLDCSLDQKLNPVKIDPAHMRRAVLNCIRNAIEAMPNGGILSLSTQKKENQVELTISDNGSGIHVEHQVRVFDPFYSTKDKGTGLGLPYVRQIVEEYDGRVELRSEPQNGTTILIRLPIMRSINTQEA